MRSSKDTRWSCHSCTACCRGFQFGPVEPEVIQNLIKQDVETWWKPASLQAWFHERSGPQDQSLHYLSAVDGHCIFLQEDGLCAVHATLGEDAKPGFCREFPHHIIEEENDYVGVIRAECEGWHKSFQSGPPIEANLDAIRALPRVVPRRRFTPKQVMLFPKTAISYAHWQHLETELCRCLEEESRGIEGDLGELRTIIRTLAGLDNPKPQPQIYEEAVRRLLQPLVHMLRGVLQIPHGDPHQVQFTKTSMQRMEQTLEALQHARLPGRSQEQDDYFNVVLRNDIIGKRFQSFGSVSAGLGAFALGTFVARCCTATPNLSENASHYAGWLRFTGIPAVQQSLSANSSALHLLFLNAIDPT